MCIPSSRMVVFRIDRCEADAAKTIHAENMCNLDPVLRAVELIHHIRCLAVFRGPGVAACAPEALLYY